MKVGREPVVRAGLALLNEAGLEGLTLRAIAAKLGVRAPTLYWRFKNKQDLLDEMATQVFADWVASLAPPVDSTTWQDAMVLFGTGLRGALLAYRDGARMIAGTYLTDSALYGPMEILLGKFAAAGISADNAAACLTTAYSYVIGFTIEEQTVLTPAGTRNPQYDLSAREARVDVARFPLTRSIGSALFDDYDVRFKRGLRMIVDGFAVSCQTL